jgi:hypothetical protein
VRAPITPEQSVVRLRDPEVDLDSSYHGPLDVPWELSPAELLGFADADLDGESDNRALVNALSNAKRALHCQVDSILYALGLHSVTESWSFPRKLELLSDLGIVTRQALGRVNESRNLTEHDYVIPSESEVRLFCDVVALFIEATDWYIGSHSWNFFTPNGGFSLKVDAPNETIILNRDVEVHATDPRYREILGLAIPLVRP